MHNPRAETARIAGCDFGTFLRLMHEDDAFDSPLTDLGIQQARDAHVAQRKKSSQQEESRNSAALSRVELLVVSPLSRAIDTGLMILCPQRGSDSDQSNNTDDLIRPDAKIVRVLFSHHLPPSPGSFIVNVSVLAIQVCWEGWREVNGWLLNAKRRCTSELQQLYPAVDFSHVVEEEDVTWGSGNREDLESGTKG
jgi:hypothetical protein